MKKQLPSKPSTVIAEVLARLLIGQTLASASSEQCTSNAQAMLEHAKTDAKTMLEQCPSSSSSSINKTHTNTGVFAPDLKMLNDTHLDAWILSHTSRLAAHIHRLKELGWSIATIIEPVACGDGRTAHIARYQLIEPPEVVGDAKVRAFVENVIQARLSGK